MERKKAIEYMSMIQSRVAVTTDMWTSDSQKKGYMAITTHFIDESWRLRNILMRYIVVKALNIVLCLFSAFATSQTDVYVCIL